MSVIAALVVLSSATPRLAFVARFYYPVGDKRRSYHQIYISDIDGRNRKQITQSKSDYESVRWLNSHLLVASRSTKSQSILETIDIRSKKVHKLATISFDIGGCYSPRVFGYRGKPYFQFGQKSILVTEKGIEPTTAKAIEPPSFGEEPNMVLQLPNLPPITMVSRTMTTVKLRREDADYNFNFGEDYMPTEIVAGRNKDESFVHGYTGGASSGCDEAVFQILWRSNKLQKILSNNSYIDFDPNSRYWAGVDAYRPMMEYGKGHQVWTSNAYAGDWRLGKRWTVASGLVFTTDIAVEPSWK